MATSRHTPSILAFSQIFYLYLQNGYPKISCAFGQTLTRLSMTIGQSILFISLLLTHIIISSIGTLVLIKSILLTRRQKLLNLILLWTIPVVWYFLIKSVHKKTPGSHEVPIKNDVSSRTFYESGLGAPGAGISNRGQ